MAACAVNMAMGDLLLRGIAHLYNFDIKVQRDTCKRMISVYGD